jgi:ribose transport system ATP-binding protein/rhamnose transport system ATP-binding protein
VALALFGALRARGEVRLGGRQGRFRTPSEAIVAGLGYVTEDRKGRGLFPLLGAGANMTVTYLRFFARLGYLSLGRENAAAAAAAKDFDLRASSLRQSAATLSGGNQQKLLLARYLLKPRTLLILDEPTRGIDVGAKAEVYALMNRLTAQGLAILMISSELPEVLGMSDRIVVMHEGRTRGELPRAQVTPDQVMELATGGR